jgi:hypothetical protein
MTIREIETAALNLGVSARATLAHKLLRSLDDLSEEEIERLWVDEALRRNAELDAGIAKTRDAEEVFRDALARLP